MITEEILHELVCPMGKYPLTTDGEYLVCTNCGTKFPVKLGIPVLLIDDALLPQGISDYKELKCFKK